MNKDIDNIHGIISVPMHILAQNLSQIVFTNVLLFLVKSCPHSVFITCLDLSLVVFDSLNSLCDWLSKHLVSHPALILEVCTLLRGFYLRSVRIFWPCVLLQELYLLDHAIFVDENTLLIMVSRAFNNTIFVHEPGFHLGLISRWT